ERDSATVRGRRHRRAHDRAPCHAVHLAGGLQRLRAPRGRSVMSNRSIVAVLLFFQLMLWAASASAAPGELPERLTLDQALEILRDRSPRSQAEQARIDVAAAGHVAARVYPNPSVSYGGLALAQGANTGAAWQHQIVLEQPLLFYGQRNV